MRVVPIRYDAPAAETRALLKQINGALFTGGAVPFFSPTGTMTPYAATAQLVFDEVASAAAAGESWPLWGTCLGHELIAVLGAGSPTVLTGGFNAENYTEVVSWTPAAAASRLWGPAADVRALYAKCVGLARWGVVGRRHRLRVGCHARLSGPLTTLTHAPPPPSFQRADLHERAHARCDAQQL